MRPKCLFNDPALRLRLSILFLSHLIRSDAPFVLPSLTLQHFIHLQDCFQTRTLFVPFALNFRLSLSRTKNQVCQTFVVLEITKMQAFWTIFWTICASKKVVLGWRFYRPRPYAFLSLLSRPLRRCIDNLDRLTIKEFAISDECAICIEFHLAYKQGNV